MDFKTPTLRIRESFTTGSSASDSDWGVFYLTEDTVVLFSHYIRQYSVITPNGTLGSIKAYDLNDNINNRSVVPFLHVSLPSRFNGRVQTDGTLHADFTNAENIMDYQPVAIYREGRPLQTKLESGLLYLTTTDGYAFQMPPRDVCTTKMVALYNPITAAWGLTAVVLLIEPFNISIPTHFRTDTTGVHPPYPGLNVLIDERVYFLSPSVYNAGDSFGISLGPIYSPSFNLSKAYSVKVAKNLTWYQKKGDVPWIINPATMAGGPLTTTGCVGGNLTISYTTTDMNVIIDTNFELHDDYYI